jgi:hypothetical protein
LWQLPGVPAGLGLTADELEAESSASSQFAPDRAVGRFGGWAWSTPDQADRRRIPLAAGLQLQMMETRDEWVLVRARDGWYGWTGAPYLVEGSAPTTA